ncbi:MULTISPECIES: hypothetical protein [unclassified Streptomyces]|uniref:hypothetical protein n=1 Tax=unclassified Streptomyces TaxID=2593676 RepID=UPI00093C41F8|nr:hypothetical protein [Streptomyces sp. CB02058]OKI92192.1 hypothetical protein AMK10_20600 [Streptomyces sp. CB02058]
MDHVDPYHLVELALGHSTGDAYVSALRHVASCPRCSSELAQMTRVVAVARGARISDLPSAPPERVWQRIAHEVLQADTRSRGHPAPRSAAKRACGERHWWSTDTGTLEHLAVIALVAGGLLVLWMRIRAGYGPGRRLRSPW